MKNFKNKEAEDIESEANHRNQAGEKEDTVERKVAVGHAEDAEKDTAIIVPGADLIVLRASIDKLFYNYRSRNKSKSR